MPLPLYSVCEPPNWLETEWTIMAQRRSSLGFLGMFGRSGDLRQIDTALRGADLHPALVPEGVKLTLVNLMTDRWPDEPPPQAYPDVARLFSYCIAGPEAFDDPTAFRAGSTRSAGSKQPLRRVTASMRKSC